MARPRYSKMQLWGRIRELHRRGEKISRSGQTRRSHTIKELDQGRLTYTILYEPSGNTKPVALDDLYAIYKELHANGWIDRDYMKVHCERILGRKKLNAPGAAMRSILRFVDDNVLDEDRKVVVRLKE